ncbi:MAG: DNA repair protein RecN [Ignavibacteriae bacterium]|nr:DNA repair protein RecN [Ignavibacteriota bacterium]MCB9244644.1 DNA repair protein RecN [Ignavibacteriales bacterium]
MIEKLYIKNYLIIKEAEIEFDKGLNILTGETGAGKSIILDALSMILGERADFSLIRSNSDKLIIEGSFDFRRNKEVRDFLVSKELDDNDGYVIIRRELNQKGTSRNFINDTPIQLSDLKEFGDIIIDIHSQNEHQSLLKKETHIKILDNFIGPNDVFPEYSGLFEEYKVLVNEYMELTRRKDELIEKRDVIEFQLREINNVNPVKGEEPELENELSKVENVENIAQSIDTVLKILYDDEQSVYPSVSIALKELKDAVKYDSDLGKLSEDLESSYITIKEVSNFLNNYKSGINFDPVRVEQIRDRLGSLNFLKKKYNMSVDELVDKAEVLSKELDMTENYDYELGKLKKRVEAQKDDVYKRAVELSKIRKKSSIELEKDVNTYLNEVGLESAEFKIDISNVIAGDEQENFSYLVKNEKIVLSKSGIDNVEFLVKINKGSDFTPLRKSASGGEISRIMLAIKASLSGRDHVPILVFDEIDAGISGRIAGKVGRVMKKLANSHQIISITHLPQIAAMSERHFLIEKVDKDDETVTNIKTLSEDEKVQEVAKLISGEKVTEAAEKSARELIG